MEDIKTIAEAFVGMTTEEVQNLSKVLKDEYGISAEEKVAQTETGMTFGGLLLLCALVGYGARWFCRRFVP